MLFRKTINHSATTHACHAKWRC